MLGVAESTTLADTPSERHLSRVLLDGKIRARTIRPGDVSRRALIDKARASSGRIVCVTAPAGYGKSTLLAEWAAAEDRTVAWASFDRFDSDPTAMLSLLATACAPLSPRAAEVVSQMGGLGTSILGRAAPMLAALLTGAHQPFVIFIDDTHVADSLACHDALEVVLAGVPEGSQAVLASRHEQPYLARLRAVAAVHEIGADDLRIDPAGARSIFAGAQAEVAEADLDGVVDRCEGWPAGLYLCAVAVRAGADVRTVTGTERFVADYLYRECLGALPEDLREFLRRTAVLEQLSAPLCDAVLGRDGSQALLRRLESQNLFLVPLDGGRQWFRYHMLFRDFLLTELDRVEPGEAAELHRRAADWFRSRDAPQEAVEHLLVAGDLEPAAELIGALALPMYQRGRVAVVERWLGELGPAVVDASPELAVLAAWTAILQGKSPASEQRLTVLNRLEPSGTPEEIVGFESARAMVRAAMCVGGPNRVLDDARYAVANEPEWSPWRDQALHLLGSAWLLVGETAAARDAFLRSSACAQAMGNADSVILSEAELAILALEDGLWKEAEGHADRAVRTIDQSHLEGYPTTALALAVRTRIAIRRAERPAADRFFARAMRARVHCTHVLPYLAMRARLQLAKAFAAMGDRSGALHMMREIDDLRLRRPNVGVLAQEIDEFRARIVGGSGSSASVPLTPAELRLLPYLQTHLTIADIGKRLFVTRNTVSTQVQSIYRKLEVTTRAGAIERAVEYGLLGE